MNDDGPWVLEIAPRPIGGLCSRALRFGPERMFLEELLVRHAMGLHAGGADARARALAAGVMMVPVPASGVLEGVEGVEQAAATPGVDEIADHRALARLHRRLAGGIELSRIYLCAGGDAG